MQEPKAILHSCYLKHKEWEGVLKDLHSNFLYLLHLQNASSPNFRKSTPLTWDKIADKSFHKRHESKLPIEELRKGYTVRGRNNLEVLVEEVMGEPPVWLPPLTPLVCLLPPRAQHPSNHWTLSKIQVRFCQFSGTHRHVTQYSAFLVLQTIGAIAFHSFCTDKTTTELVWSQHSWLGFLVRVYICYRQKVWGRSWKLGTFRMQWISFNNG